MNFEPKKIPHTALTKIERDQLDLITAVSAFPPSNYLLNIYDG